MKLVIWTGADYARHFCRHIKLIVGGCYGNKNSPNGVSVHVGAHALRTTSAIFGGHYYAF